MSESTQTKLLSSVPAISSLAEGDKITVVTAAGQTALVSLSNLQSIMRAGMSAGRNLAKDSAYIEATPMHSHLLQTTDNLRPGDVITICADDIVITGEDSNNHNSVYIDIEDASSGSWIAFVGLPRTNGRKATITLPTKSFTYNGVQMRIFAKIYSSGGVVKDTVKIYGLSAVRGSVAPLRWTPAPEDFSGGGINHSFSDASKASARISKKGGRPHEYIDNYADKGSHQCNPEAYTLGCAGVQRNASRLRRRFGAWSLSKWRNHSQCARLCIQVRTSNRSWDTVNSTALLHPGSRWWSRSRKEILVRKDHLGKRQIQVATCPEPVRGLLRKEVAA